MDEQANTEQSDSRRVQGWPIGGPWPQARITNDRILIYEPGHAHGISQEDARRLAAELVACADELLSSPSGGTR